MLTELLFGGPRKLASYDRSPLSDFWYGRVARPTASKVEVTDDTALTYSAVWAATRLLAGTAGWLPLNLYKKRAGGGRDLMSKDRRHRLVHLRPNDENTSMMFRATQVGYQVNRGNSYSEIQRVGNMPVALWTIHPSRVKVGRSDKTGELLYEVRNNNGGPSYIPAKDMLHVPSMISDDGICGKGVIQNARESIGFGLATERHGASFFGSGAIPRIIIKHPKTLSADARTTFRKEWKEIYGGPQGDDVALLAEGAEAMPIDISNEDSQFLVTRQHNVEEIARWYGVPPHMLQHLLRATFSNIEHMGIEFVVYSLIPWLKLWEQELAAKLLTEDEQSDWFFEFNVNALLRGDSAARAAFYQTLVTLGVLELNEVRELENFNPVPGGNTRYIQGAMMPIGPDGLLIPPAAPEPEEPEDDEQDEDVPTDDDDDTEDDALSRIEAYTLTVDESLARLRAEIATSHTVETVVEPADTTEIDKREAMLKVAARQMLEGATGRIVRKHAFAARRAAKKPSDFLKWNDAFAEKNADDFLRELEPCLNAFSAIGIDADAGTIVSSHLTMAHEELLEASGCAPDMFPESIEACVSNWEEGRAQAMADSVYQITVGGE